uniref:Lectin-4 n=1 Tax=Griffonia simplicifolia TaxID=3850 RepID=LEC4_GRISI|nr:RecName: Full=Lectin-4; AltName: Full=GS4; AltName: Full=Lectin IV [Griffonia simplicifolia]
QNTVNFTYPDFWSYSLKNGTEITFLGDATRIPGALQLTKTDANGNPVRSSAGQASYSEPVFLWDSTGKAASFYTSFTFLLKNYGAPTADGLAFFLAPVDSSVKDYGGFLGLFRHETAADPSKNQVVAVEFDTWINKDWNDPPYPHIGIDVNSIVSVATTRWENDDAYGSSIATAHITYDARSKILTVLLSYEHGRDYILSHVVDLAKVLPQKVRIGFSAGVGYDEVTYILSWHFFSTLDGTNK